MVAPVDSKASFEAEGATITLRLNMRTIDLANEQGVDLIYGGFGGLNSSQMASLVAALAAPDHPEMTRADALVYVAHYSAQLGEALTKLMLMASGAPEEALTSQPEGNATGREAPASE